MPTNIIFSVPSSMPGLVFNLSFFFFPIVSVMFMLSFVLLNATWRVRTTGDPLTSSLVSVAHSLGIPATSGPHIFFFSLFLFFFNKLCISRRLL